MICPALVGSGRTDEIKITRIFSILLWLISNQPSAGGSSAAKQGRSRSEWAMCFQNPVQTGLSRDLKTQRQLGLFKHSPASPFSCHLVNVDSFAPAHLALRAALRQSPVRPPSRLGVVPIFCSSISSPLSAIRDQISASLNDLLDFADEYSLQPIGLKHFLAQCPTSL